MKRNKRLLLKAAKRIEEIPESYRQETFCADSEESPCGTVACLAGEIIIASERSAAKGVAKLRSVTKEWIDNFGDWPGDIAGGLAGLNRRERDNLFPTEVNGWPKPFRSQYPRAKAKTAAALLRYLANGGEV